MRINRKQVRGTVDMLLTVPLPMQMAYSLIGETYYEAEGVPLFALFLTHHVTHRNWWKNLVRGGYNAYQMAA